ARASDAGAPSRKKEVLRLRCAPLRMTRMRRYSQRHSLSTLSEINITPLLDLAFVLLIIFMITTPLLENSVNLVIPSSGAANAPVKRGEVQTVSIDRRDAIKINDKPVTAADLAAG